MNRREFMAIPCGVALTAVADAQPPSSSQSRAAARPGPKVRTLTEQEVMDMMLGSSIQAARSSDTPNLQKRAKELLAQGKQFQIVASDDVPDDWNVVCAALTTIPPTERARNCARAACNRKTSKS